MRVAGAGRRKGVETVTTWSLMTGQILALRYHLIREQVTCAVMKATGDYWKPFYYLLEDAGFELLPSRSLMGLLSTCLPIVARVRSSPGSSSGRSGRKSAARARAAEPTRELAHAIQQHEGALPRLAHHVIGDAKMHALDSALEMWMPKLRDQPRYPNLRGQIALRWVDGESPDKVLRQATWWQDEAQPIAAAEDSGSELARVMLSGASQANSQDRRAEAG